MLLDALFRGKPGTLSRASFAIGVTCGAEGREGLCEGCSRDLPGTDHACARCAERLLLLPPRLCGNCARRPTRSQRRLDRRVCVRKLCGAFTSPDALTDLHVAVVDDVITTGSAAAEIARPVSGNWSEG